jgi:hypothetical protein
MSVPETDSYQWRRTRLLKAAAELRLAEYMQSGSLDEMEGASGSQVAGKEAGQSKERELGPLQEIQGVRDSPEAKVLSQLLNNVPQLKSTEPREIMRFFLEVKPVYDLNLVNDRVFWSKLMCRAHGSLLKFVGVAFQSGESWDQGMNRLIQEYFPVFVRETLIRELVIFNFHEKGRPLRQFIKEVTDTVNFLQYDATEG